MSRRSARVARPAAAPATASSATGDGGRAEAPWFTHLARLGDAKVSWRDVVRVAAGVVAPLALGFGLERSLSATTALSVGVLASIGAFVGSIAPQRGPLREKLARTAAGVVLGAAGLAVGRYAAGGGWEAVLVVAALAAVAALVSSLSANVSFGTLQFLVFVAVGSGLKTSLPFSDRVGVFLAGGLWAMVLTLVAALADPVDTDRAVVSEVFTALERLLEASGHGDTPSLRTAVSDALDRAYQQVVRSRSHAPGVSRRLAALAAVLNSTAPLVEGAVALYRTGQPAAPEDLRALTALASAVRTGHGLSGPSPPPLDGGSPAALRTREGLRLVWSALEGERRAGQRVLNEEPNGRARLAHLAASTLGSGDGREYAIRLALCMGVAEVVREHLPYQRPYWVVLTVAIVLKPDFGSVFARGVQRTVGTVIGVLIGAAVLALVPHDAWILIPMAVAAATMPWAQAANYGLYVVSFTPVVVMLLGLGTSGTAGLVTARLVDTLVGSGIVVIFGYLLWPRTWRSSLDGPFGRVVSALDAFVEAALCSGPEQRRSARRRTYRALGELQAELQRQLAEPPPISTRAASWWPVVVQLERTADAVIEAAVAMSSGAPAPNGARVAELRRRVRALADPAGRPATGTELADDDVLTPIARELDAASRLLDRVDTTGASALRRSRRGGPTHRSWTGIRWTRGRG